MATERDPRWCNFPCQDKITIPDDGNTYPSNLVGLTNPIHKVVYGWFLPSARHCTVLELPGMVAATDKLIERQNAWGEYVVDIELTAFINNDELVASTS